MAPERFGDRHDERQRMVAQQLAARDITDDAVLSAMAEVPRELFVPADMASAAYDDRALPIEHGQTISQPYIVALMAQALELNPQDRVLEIGTGSGYGAAVLGKIAGEVHTVERDPELTQLSERRLTGLDYANVHVHRGDGSQGWLAAAPYDAISVTAGATEVPPALRDQLAVRGRLVIPVGDGGGQTLLRIRRTESTWSTDDLGPVAFVPLVSDARP